MTTINSILHLPVPGSDPVLAFAAEELARCLAGQTPPAEMTISLCIDPALGHAHELRRSNQRLELAGGSPTAVLHAVFTLLERLGWRFDLSFPLVPATPRWEALPTHTERITPAIPRRGIRQHLNFPMDLSAWPLTEVEEYLRNLARLRFTHLTVHSYPDQWIACRLGGREQRAGGFFYSEEHPVTGPAWLRHLVGQQRWCIPAIEPLLDDPVARSAAARDWLRGLIAEAKRVGLDVSFSFEPRRADGDLADTLAQAEAILADYPSIDRLELMIEENGEERERLEPAEIRARMEPLIGAAALNTPELAALIETRAGLVKSLGQTAHNLLALAELKRRLHGRVGLDLGLYNVNPRIARGLIALWRTVAPPDTGVAVLCAHGASRVARHLSQLGMRPQELARTMLYSWVEFDGLMYLQQDDAEGLSGTLDQLLFEGVTPPGLAVNHWRVAENAWGIRYCAELCLAGRLAPRDYRFQAAKAFGIDQPGRVRLAMAALATLTDHNGDHLPNAAFSYFGCWYADRPNFGLIGWQVPAQLALAAEQYACIRTQLAQCQASTAAGEAWLALLRNRLEVSERYLRAMAVGRQVKDCLAATGDVLPGRHIEALRRCEQALAEMEAAMAVMAALIPDRSTLGTLVSMERVVQRFLRHHRDRLAGSFQSAPRSQASPGSDAPPPPALGGETSAT